jgi:hypothetical protein
MKADQNTHMKEIMAKIKANHEMLVRMKGQYEGRNEIWLRGNESNSQCP